jgi:hypothetical protein
LSAVCFLGLALVHTRLSSSLKYLFQLERLNCALSKMKAFLVVQMIQQAVMKISLKIGFPKTVLASMIMSSGCRFLFQNMGIEFQQA